MANPQWMVIRLASELDRAGFDCGKQALSSWFETNAGQAEDRDLTRVYVATGADASRVLGYYALSACQVRCADLPAEHARKVPPRMDVPAVLLGKLAVDRSVHGQGLGSFLLVDALRRAQGLADRVGVLALVVDAIDDDAHKFYEHHGFIPLLDTPGRLFLTMKMIRKLGLSPLAE